jgi:ERCC4-type nuclease
MNVENFKIGQTIKFKCRNTEKILEYKIKDIKDGKLIFENSQNLVMKENVQVNLLIDTRENINFKKRLHEHKEINVITENLNVGDIIIDEWVGIERKTPEDFVNSILDKRLFLQLKNLVLKYRRPLLIIEGNENIFSVRNVNPNVIISSLMSVMVDFRIPIMFTKTPDETIENLVFIAKKRLKKNKNLKIDNKKILSSNQENLENFIGTIPQINRTTAKQLLKYFGSVLKLTSATIEELEKVESIGKLRAKKIYEFFRLEY